ncbi:MAG TPA: hypothetical protein VFX49_21530 [Chloroflexota bacterium]|nr:hypothetical protein [Chloroflexota bacterium]
MSRTPAALTVAIAAICVTLAILAWAVGRWAAAPAAVPDHATAFSGTQPMTVAGRTVLAQRFLPGRDRLTAIDLLLASEEPGLPGDVRLEVQALPSRQVIRQARVSAAALPHGPIWEVRPGQPRERWTSFGFEPVPDTAGRELLLVLSYPDGADRPGQRVATLAHFPGLYPGGELSVNGFPVGGGGGNLLFRLASAGTRGEALHAAAQNVARAQPVAGGTLLFPLSLGAGCVLLAMAALTRLR